MPDDTPEQILKIVVDAGQSFAAFDAIERAMKRQGNAIRNLGDQLSVFDSTGKATVFTLKAIGDAGKQLSITVEKAGDSYKVLNEALKDTTSLVEQQNLSRLVRETEQLTAEEEKLAAARRKRIDSLRIDREIEQSKQLDAVLKQIVQDNINIDRATAARGAFSATNVALGPAPTTASPAELNALNTAMSRFVGLVNTGKIEAADLNRILGEVAAGSTRLYSGAEIQASSYARAVIDANSKLGQTNREQLEQQERLRTALFNTREQGTRTAQEILISWQSLARFIATHVIYSSLYALFAAFKQATEAASEFEIKISEIRTISQQSQLSMEQWTEQTKLLAIEFNKPIADVAEATYQTLSSQVAHGAESVKFMTEALKFAQVTTATTTQSVDLLSSAINSFNLNTDNAGHVAAVLAKTIELGHLRAGEMAETFGRVSSINAALGISLEETAASIATLTHNGIKSSEAFSLITNVSKALLQPTAEMEKLFKQWGVTTGQAAISAFGYVGVLKKIEEASKGNVGELGELFRNIRGLRGILGQTGSALDSYKTNLDAITNSLDGYNDKIKIATESSGFKLQKQFNELKVALQTDFGTPLVDRIEKLTEHFGSLKTNAERLTSTISLALKTFIVYRGAIALATGGVRAFEIGQGLLARAMGVTTVATRAQTAALATLEAITPYIVIGALIELATYIGTTNDRIKAQQEELQNQFNQIHEEKIQKLQEEAEKQHQILEDALDLQFQNLGQNTAILNKEINDYADSITDAFSKTKDSVEAIFKVFSDNLGKEIDELKKHITEAEQIIKQAYEEIRKISDESTKQAFDAQLKFIHEESEKAAAIVQRGKDVAAAAAQDIPKILAPNIDQKSFKDLKEKIDEEFSEQKDRTNELITLRANAEKKLIDLRKKLNETQSKDENNQHLIALEEKVKQEEEANKAQRAKGKTILATPAKDELDKYRKQLQADKSTENVAKIQEEIAAEEKILTITSEREALVKNLNDIDAARIKFLEQIAQSQQKIEDQEKATLKQQQDQQEQLKKVEKDLTEFKLLNTKGEISKQFKTEQDALNKLTEIQQEAQKAGLDDVKSFEELKLRIKQQFATKDAQEQSKRLETDSNVLRKKYEDDLKAAENAGKTATDQQNKIFLEVNRIGSKIASQSQATFGGYPLTILEGKVLVEKLKGLTDKISPETIKSLEDEARKELDNLIRYKQFSIKDIKDRGDKSGASQAEIDQEIKDLDKHGSRRKQQQEELEALLKNIEALKGTLNAQNDAQKQIDAFKIQLKELADAAAQVQQINQNIFNLPAPDKAIDNIKQYKQEIDDLNKKLQDLKTQFPNITVPNNTPTQGTTPTSLNNTNLNFGNVNINVKGENLSYDVRQIWDGILQGVRRGELAIPNEFQGAA